ncbi:hypothetical protein V7068_19040 [Bacillus sp. JJ634]
MIEKKEFLIPKNVEEGVTLFGNIKIKELIKTLLPSFLLSAGVFYTPLNPFVKIGLISGLILVPLYLISDRPVRKNIPVLYHLKTWIKYGLRQKDFIYQKERYYHAETVQMDKNKGTKTKTNRPTVHSAKSYTRKSIDYNGQQTNKTSENHLKKYGTHE